MNLILQKFWRGHPPQGGDHAVMVRCVVVAAAILLAGNACAQERTTLSQDADAVKNGASLPSTPRAESSLDALAYPHAKVLPPLPIPTDDQLRNGRAVLERLAFVLTNISITDAVAVLHNLGFDDIKIEQYPTYARFYPKSNKSETNGPLANGFFSINVQPRELGGTASIEGRFADDVCVSAEDVRSIISPLAARSAVVPVVDVHPVARPKPLNNVGHLSIYHLRNFQQQEAVGSFTFAYQTCAVAFGFSFGIDHK